MKTINLRQHVNPFCLLVLIVLGTAGILSAQSGVKIAATSGTADPSSMLDIESTNKGMLIPRMTEAQRNAIASPATGLLVFQTDNSAAFYYYNGSGWVSLSTGATLSGTPNTVAKFTSATNVGNSIITSDATNVGIGTTGIGQVGNVQISTGGASPISNRLQYGTDGSGWKFAISKNQAGTITDQLVVQDNGLFQVTNLAGTGFRPVFADATGTLTSSLTGTVVQMRAIQTRTQATYTAPTSGTGTQVTPLDMVITPRKAGNAMVLQWVLNGEMHHDCVYVVTRNGTILTNAVNGSNNRWSGVAGHPFDNDQNSTQSNVVISITDFNTLSTASTYAVCVRSSSGSVYTLALNRTLGSTGADAFEATLSTCTATEIQQ